MWLMRIEASFWDLSLKIQQWWHRLHDGDVGAQAQLSHPILCPYEFFFGHLNLSLWTLFNLTHDPDQWPCSYSRCYSYWCMGLAPICDLLFTGIGWHKSVQLYWASYVICFLINYSIYTIELRETTVWNMCPYCHPLSWFKLDSRMLNLSV